MNYLLTIIISAVVSLGVIFGIQTVQHQPQTFGAYNPTGGQTYRLQSSIGGSDSSLTLTSFKEPVSNIKYTMSYLNSSIEYATIEPQSSSKEFISFTGITQNADGTATLTGLTRGLGFSYPYTASTTLQQAHSGQSILILSNPPQLTNQYGALLNANSWTGVNTFSSTSQPVYDGAPTFTNGLALVDKTYADNLAIVGAVAGSNTVPGILMTATGLQAASSTASGVYNAQTYLRVLPSSIATDTPNTSTRGSVVLMSDITGFLKQTWLNLTQAFTVSGAWIFGGTTTFNAASTFNVAPTFGTFSATSTLTTSTSTISANLQVLKNATTTNLMVSSSCAGCVNPSIVYSATVTINSASENTATASCSGSQVVVGGGASTTPSSPYVAITQSYPSGTQTWSVGGHNTNGAGSATIAAYAICVNP